MGVAALSLDSRRGGPVMSPEFFIYLIFLTLFFVLSIKMVGWGYFSDPSRFPLVYLTLLYATYAIRPAGGEIIGDRFVYDCFGMQGFEDAAVEMTIGVSLALLMFALGYRYGGGDVPRREPER